MQKQPKPAGRLQKQYATRSVKSVFARLNAGERRIFLFYICFFIKLQKLSIFNYNFCEKTMDKRTLNILEYYRVRNSVANFACSEEGADFLRSIEPDTDAKIIEKNKTLAAEWTKALLDSQPLKILPWQKVSHLFPIFTVEGSSLNLEDLNSIGQFCASVNQLKNFSHACCAKNNLNLIEDFCTNLSDLTTPHKMIYRIIDESGTIRDLPEIKAIKNKISEIRRNVENLLKKYTSDPNLKDALQSDIPVLRSDRQVLALKANFKGKVRGIVHELSQSGHTLFIEPEDIVQKNNELVQEENRLEIEIRRIVKELTKELSNFYSDFVNSHKIMLQLDRAFASARWGIENNCIFASTTSENLSESGSENFSISTGKIEKSESRENAQSEGENTKQSEQTLVIKQGRHPLLGSKAVPISLAFLPQKKVIIITGPNTGGKTVSLKTVALFATLNQSGFPVPASEGTALPIFDDIFADIGDEQSMDQSLSTFSAHMKNIAYMTQNATEKTLILLDELGSGTDPQEGGAIAMAVLDHLIERKSFVLVTTHHGILKNYGYTKNECLNASVDFDQNTLSPVYRIIMGVPGESHALQIARRNGLNENIAKKAQKYLEGDEADVSKLIQQLSPKYEELDQLKQKQMLEEQAIKEKRRSVDLKELRLRQKENELRSQGYKRLSNFAEESRKKLENLVRTIREGEMSREKTLAVKGFINELSDALNAENDAINAENEILEHLWADAENLRIEEAELQNKARQNDKDFEKSNRMKEELANFATYTGEKNIKNAKTPNNFGVGVEVLYKGKIGTIVHKDKKDTWIVAFGNLKMPCKESNLSFAPVRLENFKPSVSVELSQNIDNGGIEGASFGKGAEKAQFELRLLGMRYEEAIKALERQIDLASMQNLKNFSVVHGKGSGILQEGVHKYLKNCNIIEEFHFARPEEGGTGKTYVTLKD